MLLEIGPIWAAAKRLFSRQSPEEEYCDEPAAYAHEPDNPLPAEPSMQAASGVETSPPPADS